MKKFTVFIISFLIAALLPYAAVRAAEKENVVLTAEEGKVKMDIHLPDVSEGVSTLRLRIKIEGEVGKLDQGSPLTFKSGAGISSELLETRFDAKQGYFTIYVSDTSKITDKADFELGTITPNTIGDEVFDLKISVPENGLDYVDGTGKLNEEFSIVSPSVVLKVNAKEETPETKPEEIPETKPEETPGTKPEEVPDSTTNGSSSVTGDRQDAASDSSDDKSTTDQPGGEQGNPVKTGDQSNFMLYLILAGISAAGIGSALIFRKK